MKYQIGQIVEGTVTGVQSYGAFVSVDAENAGLIHISELSDGFVRDVTLFVNVGDKIKVKVLDIDEKTRQMRLSLKALNPPSLRKERKHMGSASRIPNTKIGFDSLAKQLPGWIERTKKEIKHD
ncbi:MAG: CvfD/Ygs/GSP13 family RNA-binding post-transcriptional regulator [Erysipelotrichaceae bacterium]